MSGVASSRAGDVLVLIGDAQRVRVLRPAPGDALDVVWEVYAATRDVHALGQAPDMSRNSKDSPPKPGVDALLDDEAEFVRTVAQHARDLLQGRAGQRLVVIAPRSFADALEAPLGNAWPSRRGDVIYRDETKLEGEALRRVVDSTVH